MDYTPFEQPYRGRREMGLGVLLVAFYKCLTADDLRQLFK